MFRIGPIELKYIALTRHYAWRSLLDEPDRSVLGHLAVFVHLHRLMVHLARIGSVLFVSRKLLLLRYHVHVSILALLLQHLLVQNRLLLLQYLYLIMDVLLIEMLIVLSMFRSLFLTVALFHQVLSLLFVLIYLHLNVLQLLLQFFHLHLLIF